MTSIRGLALAVRLSAFLVIGLAFYPLSTPVERAVEPGFGRSLTLDLFVGLELLIIALFMGVRPRALVHWLLADTQKPATMPDRTRFGMLRLGLLLLGAVIFVVTSQGFFTRVAHLMEDVAVAQRSEIIGPLSAEDYFNVLANSLPALFGLLLVFQAGRCAKWFAGDPSAKAVHLKQDPLGGEWAEWEQLPLRTGGASMKLDPWAVVIVRLFAIFIFAFGCYAAFVGAWFSISPLDQNVGNDTLLPFGLSIVLWGSAGAMWRYPQLFAGSLCGTTDEAASDATPSAEAFYEIGVVLFGFFILIYAASDLLFWLGYLVLSGFDPLVSIWGQDWLLIGISVIELLLGIGLVVGRRSLGRLPNRIRGAT